MRYPGIAWDSAGNKTLAGIPEIESPSLSRVFPFFATAPFQKIKNSGFWPLG